MMLLSISTLTILTSWWISLVSSTPMSITKFCDNITSLAITNVTVHENGSIWDNEGQILYPPGTHWREEDLHIVCPCETSERPCLRKCCPIGQSATRELKCESGDHDFKFDVMEHEESDPMTIDGKHHFALLYGNPCRHGRIYLEPDIYDEDKFWIRKSDGFLVVPNDNMSEYGPESFCLEYFPEKEAHLPAICVPENIKSEDDDSKSLVYKIYPIFMIISTLFLVATFLVYSMIPELRNLHGMCLMSHVGSLAVTYTFLAVVQIGGKDISDVVCKMSAFIIEFAFLATFFWLNVMCFDICITFCGLPLPPGSLKEIEKKKFIMYSIYSWGCATVILIVSLIMDFTPGIPDSYLKPRFGHNRCWFDRKIDAFAYFFGPVAFLITANVIMFIITAVKIMQLNRQTDIVKKARSGNDKENRSRFQLYLKLLIVMGINWIMELVSWAIGGPDYLWYLTDIGNTLQGLFIFIIFVCKHKIRKIVMQKVCSSKSEQEGLMSKIWRSRRGYSPSKSSTSGGTASSGFTSQATGNIKMKGLGARPDRKKYEEDE